jgi:DMSO/TMAO reductase YedYZ heme-binding membrane subunit
VEIERNLLLGCFDKFVMKIFEILQKLPLKKIFSIGAYWVIPIVFASVSFFFPGGDLYSALGLVAMYLLAFLLFLKPVAMLSRRRELLYLLQFRRQFGVAVFWLALFHGAGYLLLYDLWGTPLLSDLSSHHFYGLVALVGMSVLGITSNDIAVRFLKKYWQRIHWLAYPVFIFTLLHAGLANGSLVLFSIVTSAYGVLKYLEWKQKKR